ATVGFVFRPVAPLVADLVRQGGLVQLDAEAWSGWQVQVALAQHERLLEVALAKADLLLAEEVRDRRGQLHAGGQGDWPEWVVRSDGRIIRLRHARDETHLGDAAGMAAGGLEDRRRSLRQHLAEAPLGKDPLAGGDWQVRAARDLRHDVMALAVDRLLDEHRLIRLQGPDQQLRRRRADGAVEVDGDVDVVPGGLAQLGKLL